MTASIISIAAGRIPAAITAETAPPASSVWAKPASSVRTASGARRMRSVSFVAMPSVPSEPTNAPSRSGPSSQTEQLDELAVGQHDLGREHVVRREAVLQAVRAAGVLRDVAADRADLLRRRVGRVVEPVGGDGTRNVEVRDPRLDNDLAALDVDLEDPRQSRERDDDPLRDRQRTSGEAGTRAPRNERQPLVVADAHDRLHLVHRAGQRDERRHNAVTRQSVALVCAQLLRLANHLGSRGEPGERVGRHRIRV